MRADRMQKKEEQDIYRVGKHNKLELKTEKWNNRPRPMNNNS